MFSRRFHPNKSDGFLKNRNPGYNNSLQVLFVHTVEDLHGKNTEILQDWGIRFVPVPCSADVGTRNV